MEKRITQKMGLFFKLLIPVGIALFVSLFIWSYFSIKFSVWTSVYLFIILGITISLCISSLVTNPIKKLIKETDRIGKGNYKNALNNVTRLDDIGKLALAIDDMGKKIQSKQEELNNQKEMYQNLFNQVPCSITVQNRNFKLIEFNKEFSKKFNPEYGDHCYSAYKNLNKKCEDCPVERTFIDGKSHFSEESRVNKDGSVVYWFVKTAPLKDAKGNIVAAMEMSIDISKRKKLEERAKDSEQQLIQAGKMATLGEMATGVAHELNQPLSVIKTASSFISRKISKNEPIDKDILNTLCQEIESHVDRASKITNHMRLFGRKSVLSMETVNINQILKRAFDIFSQQLKLREIEVKWELDNNLPEIMADPLKLEQVFINLLLNARDSIVIRLENNDMDDFPKRITISTTFNNSHISASISDTGTGIPKAIINKIFEPFFTTKKVGKGTGLGLSISYGIIKESNADISVENNPDGGVTFTIRFQRNPEKILPQGSVK